MELVPAWHWHVAREPLTSYCSISQASNTRTVVHVAGSNMSVSVPHVRHRRCIFGALLPDRDWTCFSTGRRSIHASNISMRASRWKAFTLAAYSNGSVIPTVIAEPTAALCHGDLDNKNEAPQAQKAN